MLCFLSAKLEINNRPINRVEPAGMVPQSPAAASTVRENEKDRALYLLARLPGVAGRVCRGAGCSLQPAPGLLDGP